eukprot:6208860-Pleurochrysis_carterae.AAC.8
MQTSMGRGLFQLRPRTSSLLPGWAAPTARIMSPTAPLVSGSVWAHRWAYRRVGCLPVHRLIEDQEAWMRSSVAPSFSTARSSPRNRSA